MMRVFLSGPMGSGKSTLGRALGAELGWPVYDLDSYLCERQQASVPELFARLGEAGFRQVEAQALQALLQTGGDYVVSLGGGTVTQPALRARLLEAGLLLTLEAPLAVLQARVGQGAGRPLLGGADLAARLSEILASRRTAYAECHGVIDAGEPDLAQQVACARAIMDRAPIAVPLGDRTYRVEVAPGIRQEVVDRVADTSGIVLVSDETVAPHWLQPLSSALQARGLRHTSVVIPAGESEKHIGSVQRIWDAALAFGIDRRAMLIGVGGGVIGDMTGFAAATLLRGVRVGHMPTTLLSMVDSAVGGKTGFDTPQGKNLIGAFHQPAFVLADPDVLRTLPDAELRAGLAEVVKSAWIDGEASVAMLEADAAALLRRDEAALVRAIRMSCRLKARVVTADEHEGGLRAVLNLGHTVGHAIEAAQGYEGVRHGEAVALGMVAACRFAGRRGLQSQAASARLLSLLQALELPVDVDRYLDARTLAFIAADKKRAGAEVTFVMPGSPGDVGLVRVPLSEVAAGVMP